MHPSTSLPPQAIDAKRRILEAASDLVAEQGAAHLTFDALAERTGISKGGVLHHFRCKRDLIKAMVDQHAERFLQAFHAQVAAYVGTHNAGLKGHLAAMFDDAKDAPTDGERSLLAAVANEPALLDGMRRILVEHYRTLALARSVQREDAATLMLATAGLVFLGCFAIEPFTSEERAAIEQHLLREADALHED